MNLAGDRWRTVLTMAALACCGLLAACGDPPSAQKAAGNDDGAPVVADPAADAAASADAEDDTPAFRTAAECGKCHVQIYAEWRASYHGRAMTDPLFRELSAEVNKEECIRCHAPVNLRDSGFETPVARSELREDAIRDWVLGGRDDE